jgi:hypothetical protein
VYARDVVRSFKKQYGKKDWKRRFFAWKNAHPNRAAKTVRTARKKGHGGVIRSLAKRRVR